MDWFCRATYYHRQYGVGRDPKRFPGTNACGIACLDSGSVQVPARLSLSYLRRALRVELLHERAAGNAEAGTAHPLEEGLDVVRLGAEEEHIAALDELRGSGGEPVGKGQGTVRARGKADDSRRKETAAARAAAP